MKYSVDELAILRDIRASGYDGKFQDDLYRTDQGNFLRETSNFLNWLKKWRAKIE